MPLVSEDAFSILHSVGLPGNENNYLLVWHPENEIGTAKSSAKYLKTSIDFGSYINQQIKTISVSKIDVPLRFTFFL
jgi:hypothetical protein